MKVTGTSGWQQQRKESLLFQLYFGGETTELDNGLDVEEDWKRERSKDGLQVSELRNYAEGGAICKDGKD